MNTSLKKNYLPWIVCLSASLYLFFVFMQMLLPNTIGEELLQRFHFTAHELTLFSISYFLANTIALIPAAILIDRGSTRFYIIFGMTFMTLSAISLAFPNSVAIIFFGRACAGVGSAFAFTSCIKLVSRWFPEERIATVMGIMNSMALFGGLMAQTPTAYFITHYGFVPVMQAYAIVTFLSLLLMVFIVRNHPAHHVEPALNPNAMSPLRQLAATYGNPQNWLAAFYAGLILQPMVLLGGLWGIMYLEQAHHLSKLAAANLTLLIFLGCMIGNPIIGWCSDAIKSRRLLMFLCGMLALTCLFLITFLPNEQLVVLSILFFLMGFAISGQLLSYPLITANNPLELTATANSTISLTIVGLGVITQPTFTWLMEYNWLPAWENNVPLFNKTDYHLAFSLLVASVVIATCLVFFIKRQKP